MEKLETKPLSVEVPGTLQPEEQLTLNGVTRVLIGGMDGAGKSTLSCSLYLALKERGVHVSLHEIDPWSDTHDPILGRKPWSDRNKRAEVPDHEYLERVEEFKNDNADIVIGDMQGRSQYRGNYALYESAHHGILVSREATPKDETRRWRQSEHDWEQLFCDLNIPVNLRIRSLRPNQQCPDNYIGIDDLERVPEPNHEGVQKTGQMIVNLIQNHK